jgi:uncharacterized protein with gpF-like domain
VLAAEPFIGPTVAQIAAQKYALARGGELLSLNGNVSVVNATRKRVGVIVSQGIEEGQSLGTIQANLRADNIFSRDRAVSIARTETATALGQGEREAAMRAGRNEKHWMTQGDELVEEQICAPNSYQGWIEADQPFQSGHDTIPGHPRCRCVVRYRTVDPEAIATGLLPEIRCPRCNKLVATKHAAGTHEYCPRCKDDFSA